jgi:6-pyruvoyltetrahydropterin/6-carboxytetrahydropterin synthase
VETVTRRFEFDAAHRLIGHQGKCRWLHGHHYVAEVQVATEQLNDLGMAIDFGDLKTLIGGWINDHWDHNIILNTSDPLAQIYGADVDALVGPNIVGDAMVSARNWCKSITPKIFGDRLPYLLRRTNPTVEVLVKELYQQLWKQILVSSEYRGRLAITHIRLFETPNCWADHYTKAIFSPKGSDR